MTARSGYFTENSDSRLPTRPLALRRGLLLLLVACGLCSSCRGPSVGFADLENGFGGSNGGRIAGVGGLSSGGLAQSTGGKGATPEFALGGQTATGGRGGGGGPIGTGGNIPFSTLEQTGGIEGTGPYSLGGREATSGGTGPAGAGGVIPPSTVELTGGSASGGGQAGSPARCKLDRSIVGRCRIL
jgi:hypothetical protein